jgi:hypothetical protein
MSAEAGGCARRCLACVSERSGPSASRLPPRRGEGEALIFSGYRYKDIFISS